MMRNICSLLTVIIIILTVNGRATGQNYVPGPAPTLGAAAILTQTVLGPTPLNRTIVGIGEQINCSIDPTSWQDTDYLVEYGNIFGQASDNIGEITWSVDQGNVMPVVGATTTVTAPFLSAPGQMTITATVLDAGVFAFDNVPRAAKKVLSVDVPGSVNVLSATDNPDWKTGNNNYGASTNFLCQVIPKANPTAGVNFSAVSITSKICCSGKLDMG